MSPPLAFVRGVGLMPVTRSFHPPSFTQSAKQAISSCLSHAGVSTDKVTALIVGNMLSPILQKQSQLATLIAEDANLVDVETLTIDAACGSGGQALRQGVLSILSGQHDYVLVVGIEEMSNPKDKSHLTQSLAQASHWAEEGSKGSTFISLNSLLTTAYLDRHGYSSDDFFAFAANSHANAVSAPHALLKKNISKEEYLSSKTLAANIRLYDACPTCSGCAAVLLSSTGALGQDPVILASESRTDTLNLSRRKDLLELRALKLSAEAAFAKADCAPKDVGLYEAHDAYSVMSALSLEAAGFCKPGEGMKLGQQGEIALNGSIPLSTFGGLKARGHAVGASGVYQAAEVYLQLTDSAGPLNQVAFKPGTRIGMMSSFGGAATSCATHLMAL